MNKAALIVLSSTLIFPLLLSAAGLENSPDKEFAELRKRIETRQQERVGKTYYGYFNRKSCRYPYRLAVQSAPIYSDPNRYLSDSPKRIFVEGVVRSQTRGHENTGRFYRIKLEDGSVGFIDVHEFRSGNPEQEQSLRDDCLFELEPQEVQARLEKFSSDKIVKLEAQAEERRAKLEVQAEERRQVEERAAKRETERHADYNARLKKEEAIAKRPNARIGMTAKQVIEKTNWGEPESINRTITQYGVDEQWVYGLGNYLYFKNGRLQAIQN